MTTTTTSSQQQQQQTTFIDDGHYSDIHGDISGGTATIQTQRRPFVDESRHYSYIEFNQPTSDPNTVEQVMKQLVHAFINRLDYCNDILTQLHAAARLRQGL